MCQGMACKLTGAVKPVLWWITVMKHAKLYGACEIPRRKENTLHVIYVLNIYANFHINQM